MNIKVYELTRFDTLEVIELPDYTIEVHKFHDSINKVLLKGGVLEEEIDITEQVKMAERLFDHIGCF